jgi:hypothetical protein
MHEHDMTRGSANSKEILRIADKNCKQLCVAGVGVHNTKS